MLALSVLLDPQDANMPFTGTRVNTRVIFGATPNATYYRIDGTAAYVSNGLSGFLRSATPAANAATFCTSQYVVGVGAFNNGTSNLSGSYATFWGYGVVDGVANTTFGLDALNTTANAVNLGSTASVLNVDGSVRIDAFRVTGAGVKPRCG